MSRSMQSRETWRRLNDWQAGQAAAERLSAQILRAEGFQSVDPAHPLGGPDGLKDMICMKGQKKWLGAVHFPRGQQTFSEIKQKFEHDLAGVAKNQANGIAFVTNQELRLSEREELSTVAGAISVDLFHLERIASRLDSPDCYGIRLEFLDMEMTKEEQISFIAKRDIVFSDMLDLIRSLTPVSIMMPKEKQAEVLHVTPRDLGAMTYLSASFTPKRPYECSGCKAVFTVDSPLFFATSSGSVFDHMWAVTCPFCGRTERYKYTF